MDLYLSQWLTSLDSNVGCLLDSLSEKLDKGNAKSLATLLTAQNIEAFRRRHLSTVCKMLQLSNNDVEDLAPCSPLQEGIISRSLNSNTSLYFERFYFELLPNTDINRLRLAWEKVVASTQVLRTRFCSTTDGYAQIVCKNSNLSWHVEEVTGEKTLQDVQCHSYNRWYESNRELSKSLFEIVILHSPKWRWQCLHIFHALYDGLSLPMIIQKAFLEYYRVPKIKYGPPFLEALAYGPLCKVDGAKNFWENQLRGLTYHSLTSAAHPLGNAASANIEISFSLMAESCRRYNTTHLSLIQAAWVVTLCKYFPSETSFGMLVSGRLIDFDEVDRVLGPLFNTVPFYMNIRECKSWTDIVDRCHEMNTAMLPYQHSSLRDIMRWCQRLPEQPLFKTLFVFHKETDLELTNLQRLWNQTQAAPQIDVSYMLTLN